MSYYLEQAKNRMMGRRQRSMPVFESEATRIANRTISNEIWTGMDRAAGGIDRVASGATWAAKKVMMSRYGGTFLAPAALSMLDDSRIGGAKYSAAGYQGAGFVGAQMATEAFGAVAGFAGAAIAGKETVHGAFILGGKEIASREMAMFSRGLLARGVGGAIGAAGGALFLGSIAASILTPEGSAINEASKYVMGDKLGEWMEQQSDKIWNKRRGGFGNGSVVNTQNALQAREMMKALIGQSAGNMMGQEASFLHN